MTIHIDGDGCPRPVKEIVFRAAERLGIHAVLVANRDVRVPRSRFVRAVRVARGFDVADHHILGEAVSGDVVITADIPLAAELVPRGVHVISPRGEVYDPENIADRLATRNLLQGLRDLGEVTGGPPPFGPADRRSLASALDRVLTKRAKDRG